jgi:anti-sigma B factor antagonist
MSMKASQRVFDEVVVVDLSGRVTLGEGSVVLRDTVKWEVSRGKKLFVLNLGDVSYADSSGIGELVSATTLARRAGGDIRLLHLTKKVKELLQITKFYTIWDVFDDEQQAISSYSNPPRYCHCPICTHSRTSPPNEGAGAWNPQNCAVCGTRFLVEPVTDTDQRVAVKETEAVTYFGEVVRVVAGWPNRITVRGRLNLFTSFVLRRCFFAIPVPRYAIIAIDKEAEVDRGGYGALAQMITSLEDGDRAALAILESSHEAGQMLEDVPVYRDEASAWAAIAGAKVPAWSTPVSIRLAWQESSLKESSWGRSPE